ncbi:MAG: pitrilysin family protein [Patescibacteria group bacterium]
MHNKRTLKNGLRIITVPMKGTQAVTVLVLVGVGSKNETKEINGISHFLEHMFFKGTKKRPNTTAIIEPLDRVGGMYNAFTGKEQTGFWAKANSENLDIVLDWVSDIFLNSQFDEKKINKEKGVIIQEMKMYLDTPMINIQNVWEKLLYGNQPSGWPVIGEKDNIMRFQRKDFVDYKKKHYLASNTVVCIAGNIEPEITERKVRKYFKRIKIKEPTPSLKVIEKQINPEVLIHYKKTDQTHLHLGVRGYSMFNPSKYVQLVLATILGGYMSSRVWISVREKKGLAYYVKTNAEEMTDTGFLVTRAGIDHQKVKLAISLILKEYCKIKNRKVSKSELQKAKDNIKGSFYLSLESSDAQAAFYADQELSKNKILSPSEEISRIEKVTADDILKVANDIFQSSKLNLALIGPFEDKKQFEKLLKI